MTTDQQIINFCETLLEPEKFSDYCKNGVQISGKKEVKKITLGVSASKNFLEKSAQWGADLCICHHGIIFGKVQEINDVLRGRLKILIENNMGLIGFHLPLDAHLEVGNNAVIAQKLGLKNIKPVNVGVIGDLPHPENFQKFLEKTENIMGQNANFSENFGPEISQRIGIISGGASKYSREVMEYGADTFIFGELSESSFHELKERNLNFIAAGHYATEVFGIQALGEKIAEKFPDIQIQFIPEICTI